MMENKPVLSIDLKKGRIRIHKITLQMLGTPEYIQLLVNPQRKAIALKETTAMDHLALHIPLGFSKKPYHELYSRDLIIALKDLHFDGAGGIYRIEGNYISQEGIAEFNLQDAKRFLG